jgi:alpha-glucoside transport system substrate-binding protein
MCVVGCVDGDEPDGRPVVEVFGNVIGDAGEQLGRAMRDVSDGGPVELRYVGVSSFNAQLADRLDRGDRPGIVLLPQPGRLEDLAARGVLAPLDPDLVERLDDLYPSTLVDLASIAGVPRAVWVSVDVKGLVWYRSSMFADRALQVPRTLDEFDSLASDERIDGDTTAPFCLAIEAGASTGWVATDWVENYVLRRLGSDVYDRWTSGSLAFDSPELESVFAELDSVLRSRGATAGGVGAALDTPWTAVAAQLLAPTRPCLMVMQGDFLRREFPAGTTIGPDGDVDFFVLPGVDGARPLVLGGVLAAPLDDAPEVVDAMEVLAGAEFATALARSGSFLSPHEQVDPASLGGPVSARLLELVDGATELRFDGSDLMTPEIGTGTFWSGMLSFLGGENIRSVLEQIEAGRPPVEVLRAG